jgi:peptidoglycan/xylan/chitin deacetylase (PgdA/CDA1 family)
MKISPNSAGDDRDRTVRGKLRREMARVLNRRPLRQPVTRPMVSFSFDDVPLSAATAGAEILEAASARGAFYVCGGFASGAEGDNGPYADWATLAALAARGHEVGCHTFGHRNCAKLGAEPARAQARRNQDAFVAHGLPRPATFAFPFGDVSPRAKAALSSDYQMLRATWPGLLRQGRDLDAAPAVAFEGASAFDTARVWLERARAERAWLILYSHDVSDRPSPFGCTPMALAQAVRLAVEWDVQVVTVAEGLRTLTQGASVSSR